MVNTSKPVVLCMPADMTQLVLVKSALQSEGIDFFVENEETSLMYGNFTPDVQAVVVVRSQDLEAATEAIEQLIGYKR